MVALLWSQVEVLDKTGAEASTPGVPSRRRFLVVLDVLSCY
jgi:hypothetical protein